MAIDKKKMQDTFYFIDLISQRSKPLNTGGMK